MTVQFGTTGVLSPLTKTVCWIGVWGVAMDDWTRDAKVGREGRNAGAKSTGGVGGVPLLRCSRPEEAGRARRGNVVSAGANRATIDLAGLRANLGLARERAGRREVIPVVKADAYGHGAAAVARCLEAEGCRRQAVVTAEEGAGLREAGIRGQILVMGGLGDAQDSRLAAAHGLCPVIHHRESLAWASEAAAGRDRPLEVHLEVDTGMRRMGIEHAGAADLAAEIQACSELQLSGTYTHFASADSPDASASLEQIRLFRAALEGMRERGIDPGLVHAANSSALLAGGEILAALPEAGAVRPGLMLYGACSAPHEDPDRRLQPVMCVQTRVAALRRREAGDAVGYGATWRAEGPVRVATLALGYADGVLRSLSNRGEVWLAGARRPLVGRVSMDSLAVAVTDPAAEIAVGDSATFFGRPPEGGEGIRVEEQAEAAGTLAYELLVRVGDRVPRTFVGER